MILIYLHIELGTVVASLFLTASVSESLPSSSTNYYFLASMAAMQGNFPSTSPPGGRGGLYLEGQFNGGFFALQVWGAFTWRGLYMEGLIFGILPFILTPIYRSVWSRQRMFWGYVILLNPRMNCKYENSHDIHSSFGEQLRPFYDGLLDINGENLRCIFERYKKPFAREGT